MQLRSKQISFAGDQWNYCTNIQALENATSKPAFPSITVIFLHRITVSQYEGLYLEAIWRHLDRMQRYPPVRAS
jgi:hypothetical protein